MFVQCKDCHTQLTPSELVPSKKENYIVSRDNRVIIGKIAYCPTCMSSKLEKLNEVQR